MINYIQTVCSMKQKSVLAFSGGLDTSVVVKYMQEMHDVDVITVTVDVGQGDNANKILRKAKKLGVKKQNSLGNHCRLRLKKRTGIDSKLNFRKFVRFW